MVFESEKDSREIELGVGDIIEYTCNMTGEKVRRIVVVGDTGYMCLRLDTMAQVLNRTSLNSIKEFYKCEMDFKIIKSENLKIVEVA